MKIFALILLGVIFLTDAVEVTDDDANSPLVSYLLAKVQRLEARLMSKPVNSIGRNTKEVERHSRSVDANTSTDGKQTVAKECPQPVVTYIRWGNSTCPYGANTIYKGRAAGGRHDYKGSPSNMMCLPPNIVRIPKSPWPYGDSYIYAVEYRTGGAIDHSLYRNMPCALCEATGRSDEMMIPGHYVCPDSWHKEYSGYIMAGSNGQEGSSMYTCIDEHLEQIPGTGGGGVNIHLLYTARIYGSHIPGGSSYALSCVVCTK